MNLKKLIKSKTFIILSISTIFLSTIICYFIFQFKTPPTTPIVSTPLTKEELNPKDAQSYHLALQKWLMGAPIKQFEDYTASNIRDQLGRTDLTLYDATGKKHPYTYQKGWLYDNWQIDGKECTFSKDRYLQYNTTPPPTPPQNVKVGYYLLVEEFEFNPNHLIRTTQYNSDGSKKITEYNPQTKTKIKEVVCLTDNFIHSITDFDNSGKKTKEIFYDTCGAKNVREYNPHSGDLINSSFYPKETNKTEYHF